MTRADLIEAGAERLTRLERFHIWAVRRTFDPGPLDQAIRFCQRHIGAQWIWHSTKNLLTVHGLERLPPLEPANSFICASNHRSFFDLYVITAYLVRLGMPHRLIFPVRSEFFYDHPLGGFVNGVMSFFAMYPPIFRDRARAQLNLVGLDELTEMMNRGGMFLGIHPEGTRKKDGDPYTFLPAQPGVGRIIHQSRSVVLPVFINGLLNDLPRQVASNFDGTGTKIHVVFGRPLDVAELRTARGSPRTYRTIAERTLEAIAVLGQEERAIRGASAR